MIQESEINVLNFRLKRSTAILLGVVLLALVVRVIYVLLAPSLDPIIRQNPLYGDAIGYHILAENLVQGLGLTWDGQTPTSFRMPGYPLFLAAIYALAGPEPEAVRLVQAVLGALTCIPVFAVARRLGGEAVALLAGLGVALHPILLYMTAWVYSETLFFLFLWSGVWLLLRIIDDDSIRYAVLGGLTLGLATLVRPEVMAFPFVVVLVGVVLRWSRRTLGLLIVAQAALLVAVMPWTVRNAFAHGQLVVLTTNTGAVLYGGNNAQANGGYYLDVPFVLPGYTETDSNAELTRRAVTWIRQNPGDFISLLPKKMYKFFAPTEMEHSGSPFGRWTGPINAVYSLFLVAAVGGGVVGWRRDDKTVVLLAALVAWYLFISLVLYGGTRVALPVAPALVALAACGITFLLQKNVNIPIEARTGQTS